MSSDNAMPWHGTHGFPLTSLSVMRNAPPHAGVYIVYRTLECPLYIGESADVRATLLEQLARDHDRLTRQGPLLFAYELVSTEPDRQARALALALELSPPGGEPSRTPAQPIWAAPRRDRGERAARSG